MPPLSGSMSTLSSKSTDSDHLAPRGVEAGLAQRGLEQPVQATQLLALDVGGDDRHRGGVARHVAERVRQLGGRHLVVGSTAAHEGQAEHAQRHPQPPHWTQGSAARVRRRMAAGAETLKRTPLYDRHVAAGRAARPVRRLGDAGPVHGHPRGARRGARGRRRLRRLAHGRGGDDRARRRGASSSACCPTTSRKIAVDGAQYSVLCRENGGVLDDLFTYRHGDGFLTVTNASNHERDLAWLRRQARGYDVTVHDRLHDYAMLAVQGPEAREPRRRGWPTPSCPPRFRTARLQRGRRARHARLRDRLHGRGRGRAADRARLRGPGVGRADARRAPRRPASARATRCGSRSASTSTATT